MVQPVQDMASGRPRKEGHQLQRGCQELHHSMRRQRVLQSLRRALERAGLLQDIHAAHQEGHLQAISQVLAKDADS